MSFQTFDQLDPRNRRSTVPAFVSRLWHHRGGTDVGPIKHTDLVLLDSKGNHIYAEISADVVPKFIDILEEGRVYELSKILVFPNKRSYRSVESRLMIRITKFTKPVPVEGIEDQFPHCTYALTPFSSLPDPTDLPERFTDVIGAITSVSNVGEFYSINRTEPSFKRVITLTDRMGQKLNVVLWGQRAKEFEEEDVLAIGETDPVVAIFVGTLVKDYEDGRCLSGSSACRWYINEDLPDITDLYKRLQGKTVPIERIVLPGQDSDSIAALENIETKTVTELTALDLFDNEKTNFFCTATILDIAPQRWWFSSCTTCHKSATPHGSTYVCSNEWCPGTRACPRYKACFVVSDGQSQVEFVFFDRVAAQLIGKPLINLLRFGQPNGASLEDIVSAARDSPVTPREILAVISKKFRCVVSLSSKAFSDEELTPSYQVDRIDTEIEKRASFSVIKSKTPFLPSAAKQSALSAPTGSETPTRTDEDEIETEAPLILKC